MTDLRRVRIRQSQGGAMKCRSWPLSNTLYVQWFDSIDKDRNGTLDALELQQALRLGNLHFSLFAVAQMVR